MRLLNRRRFLGESASLAAAITAGPLLLTRYLRADDEAGYTPSTLFLTWQRDPTTTMTIQWVGGERGAGDPADPTVHVESADGIDRIDLVPRISPFPLTDRKLYRVELEKLRPGQEYEFRIGHSEVPHRFRTMPSRMTNSFNFVSGGDCGVNSHVVANNLLAARQDPWFAIIGGDLAYDNGRSPEVTLAFLKNYSRTMIDSKGRLIPMVVTIGNHEVLGGFDRPRANAPMYFALFDGLFSERSYGTLDFGDYLSLILLDTGHVSPIAGEQTSWLNHALAERRDRPHVIVVNHVPAYPSFRPVEIEGGKGTGEEQRKNWVPLFEKHGVDLVLEHHDHTFKRTHALKNGHADKDGIVYLGDGSWGKLRVPKSPDSRPYLASVSTAYHLTLHRIEGEQRFHLALEESGKIIDICMTMKKPRHRQVGI